MQPSRQQSAATEDFSRLLDRVHEIGRGVVLASARDVDRDARFPSEGIGALKELKLLSAYVPTELGGMGLDGVEIAKVCEVLGQQDGTVAMIYAMHQIQVACLVHHGLGSSILRTYLQQLVQQQRLIASATTEVGTGGDLRSSVCAIDIREGRFQLVKKAPVISYGAHADDIMATRRRSGDAPASDQGMGVARKDSYTLEPISGWGTLGVRRACRSGFVLTAS